MKKNDPVKKELIETLVSHIARSSYMDNCFKLSTREESVRGIAIAILNQYDVTKIPVKRPSNKRGVVDIRRDPIVNANTVGGGNKSRLRADAKILKVLSTKNKLLIITTVVSVSSGKRLLH